MKILLFILLIIILVGVFSSIRIVPQTYVYIIERLGKYHTEWGAGLHLKVPFIDSVANRVSLTLLHDVYSDELADKTFSFMNMNRSVDTLISSHDWSYLDKGCSFI